MCKHLSVIKFDINIINVPAKIPNNKLKKIHVLIALIATVSLFIANFSETITVTAIFNPDVATVIKNKYTAITKLNIPSSVKQIGMQAFAFGSLEELTLNEGLEEIGFEAFSHNNLKTINIPNTVTKIGDGAFNTNLMNDENLFIYNRNADGTINYSYLNSYGNRTKTNIIFKDNIKRLGSHSLYLLDNLAELNIPNTVEEIDNEFIYNNKKLKTVNIGSGIKIIHDNAFYRIGNNEELTININKKENQIEGAPWNGENIKVNWLG